MELGFRFPGSGFRFAAAALAVAAAAACSAPRLTPADAQKMIEGHPRFRAPQMLRVPRRYCAARPDPAAATTPAPDPNRLQALEGARVITTTRRAATGDECATRPGADLVDVKLTEVASTFHPTTLEDDRGWEFVLASRKFISVTDVAYDDPADPKLAHVGYAWAWEPTLLGQLLQIGSVKQGASATFLRDGNGWVVRQPGM